MRIGIAGGLVLAGLILGALSGSIWILICFVAAGFSVAAAFEAVKLHKEQKATSYKLMQYPPYRY